jgi:uncharacterized protein
MSKRAISSLVRRLAGCVLAAAALAGAPAYALGVDCAKIANPDENTICSEVELSKLDKELANTYMLVSANLPLRTRDYLKESQDKWWASADGPRSGACKGDLACIRSKYKDRVVYLRNPNFRYEGVYAAKSTRLAVQSFGSGALRIAFLGADPAAPLPAFDETKGLKIDERVMVLPPPAENCTLRVEFTLEGGATVYVKEAKKKACDKVKGLAGVYRRDYAAVPGK